MIYDITPITFNQLDLLSAGHPQGGLQQTGHMAHLAAPDVAATDLIGVTRNGVLTAGCLIAWTRAGSVWRVVSGLVHCVRSTIRSSWRT